MEEGNQELVHNESLLDLLMKQQTRGEHGVRLSFHQELLSSVAFNSSPYHYCAVTGDTELAIFLYNRGIEMTSNITVASFSAAGTNGNTPWKKVIVITPHEAALLAGNHRAARALKLIEKSVPLYWSPKQHKLLPQEFKNKARAWMESVVTSKWFLQLPGPARVLIVERVMNHFFHSIVWSCVAKRTWYQSWETTLGTVLYAAASELPEDLHQGPKPSVGPPFPQYQFRVAQADAAARRSHPLLQAVRPLRRAAFGIIWWGLQKHFGGGVPLSGAVLACVAGGFHPYLDKAPLVVAALGNLPRKS